MSESTHPYSDDIYNAVDEDSNDDELYDVAAGLGLGDSSYRPAGPTQYHQQQQQQQQQQQPEPTEDEVLSPSDGYFHRSGPQSGSSATTAYPSHRSTAYQRPHDPVPSHRSPPASAPTSSQVPHVPNVWVSDPSLAQGSSDKAREAQEERDHHYQTRRFADQARRVHPPGISPPHAGASSTTANISPFSLLNPHYPPAPARSPPTAAAAASPVPSSSAATHRYTPSSSSSSSAAGPRRSATVYTERSSLFHDDAPPAYTPSPTSPTSNSSGSNSSNYQTFSPTSFAAPGTMGRLSESESHGLMAGQTYQAIPQSMGGELDPNDDGHFEYPRPVTWKDRVREFDWRKHWKLVLLGVALTFVTVGFLVNAISGVKNERTIEYPGSQPVTSPPENAPLPILDDDGTRLAYPPYDNQDFAKFNNNGQCGDKIHYYNRLTFQLDFSPSRNASVFQDVKDGEPYHGKDIHVDGQVVIRRAGTGTPAPSIVLETASNDDTLQYTVDWNDDEQRLYLLTPRSMPWPEPHTSPCLTIRATMWVPPNSALASLNVDTVHLGIALLDNLSLQLSAFARLASTVGAIVSATDGEKDKATLMHDAPPASYALDSRYIEVKTMSAAISGAWPLYDYLGFETISGSIHAGVTPKPALKDKPVPAVLYVHSTSGTIELFEPIVAASAAFATATSSSSVEGLGTPTTEALLPPRQYGVDLYSMSGSVKAQVAFGFSCKVHTTSGHVDLTLLPVLDRAQADRAGGADGTPGTSFLETHTTSGTTVINVLEPLWGEITQRGGGGAYVSLLSASTPRAARETTGIGARDPYNLIVGHPANDDEDDDGPLPPGVVVTTPPAAAAPATGASSAARHALRILNGRHSATSATVRVTYPASWEGWIDEDSMTGSLSVAGKGVTIVRQGEDFPGIKRHLLARKGDADTSGSLKMHTTSGSIGVVIGS